MASYDPHVALKDANSVASALFESSTQPGVILRGQEDAITLRILVDASGGSSIVFFQETPVGAIDGVNTVYTLTNSPANNSLFLRIARQPQELTYDYTLSGNTITFLTPLDASLSGQPFIAQYAVSSGGIGNPISVETPGGLINGSNVTYTTVNPINTVIGIWLNGEFIGPSEYTVSGSGFTMGTAIPGSFSGSEFTIVYV